MITAWMGGTSPRPFDEISTEERQIVRMLYKDSCTVYRAFWGDCPIEVRRTFWTHARYDAHATVRGRLARPSPPGDWSKR